MADKKISQLTALSAANVASATDVLAIVDTSATETKKITAKDLIDGALNGGTANGVLYLNGSKVATSGSALVFDGTNVDFGTVGAKLNFPTTSSSTKNYVGGAADGFSLEMVTQRGAIQPISYKQDYSVGHVWSLTGTGAMALTSTGLGIGTTTPGRLFDAQKDQNSATQFRIRNDNNGTASQASVSASYGDFSQYVTMAQYSPSFTTSGLRVANSSGVFTNGNTNGLRVYTLDSAPLIFGTADTERGRFTAGGFFKASNTGTYANSTNDRYEFSSDKDDINIIVRTTSTGASVVNLYSQFPAGPTAGAYHFAGAIAGSGYQFTVDADGDVKNTNGSYAAISDLKLKQDIEDAASQWDDIKSVRVRKYRFKRTPDAPLQIGVIAQELEQTSPGLVSEDADRDDENNDLGTTTKSVKYSILYMKAVKALQEAMARIESLEADVAALKGAK